MPLRENPKSKGYLRTLQQYKWHLSYRIEHPWLLIPFIFKRSSAYNGFMKTIKKLHEFSEYIIDERTKMFNYNEHHANTKLPLLDLMLHIKQTSGDIDDEGIKEELDTFIGAVSGF